MSTRPGRSFEMTIDIDAPVDAVWKALTDAEELTRWFPFEARVTPGEGGEWCASWGGAWTWDSRITAWEPNRLLRTAYTQAGSFDASGLQAPPTGPPIEIAVDYHLESRGGKTVLRLVHSGFGPGAEWDDEVDGISHGWPFELRVLRHYLTRHLGAVRRVAWAHLTTPLSLGDAWALLAGPRGASLNGAVDGLSEGDPYAIRLATGDTFSGSVLTLRAPRSFGGDARELNDGLFRLSTERAGGQTAVFLYAAAWNVEPGSIAALEQRFSTLLTNLFEAEVRTAGQHC